jgi:hypothetical protein
MKPISRALATLLFGLASHQAEAGHTCGPNVDRNKMVLYSQPGGEVLSSLAPKERHSVELDCSFAVPPRFSRAEKYGRELEWLPPWAAGCRSGWVRVLEKGSRREIGWTTLDSDKPLNCSSRF